jgi:hypothetical protein
MIIPLFFCSPSSPSFFCLATKSPAASPAQKNNIKETKACCFFPPPRFLSSYAAVVAHPQHVFCGILQGLKTAIAVRLCVHTTHKPLSLSLSPLSLFFVSAQEEDMPFRPGMVGKVMRLMPLQHG